MELSEKMKAYWQANVKLLIGCLVVWFVVSFGFGILLVDVLNSVSLGGYPLGFWFAQQGSIYTFIGIIFFYMYKMNKLDVEYDVDEK
jgi:putative solute:sodium symporter small subunit